MWSISPESPHPIVACAETARAAVDAVAGVQPVYMSPGDKSAALIGPARVEAQLAELRLRIMAAADDLAQTDGSRDVATWLAHHTRAEPRPLRADLELAKKLDTRYNGVAAGMAAGTVSVGQAHAITGALDDLADSDAITPEILSKAEGELVDHAQSFRPHQLRRLGRRILDVIAPEIAEAEEARILAEQEQEAQKKARLDLRPLGDGTTRITGRVPDPIATRLKTYLDAYTSPRHRDPDETEAGPGRFGIREADRIPQTKKYADAFAALLEHLDPGSLPEHGGDATTVMITLTLDQLRTELAAAGLIDDPTGLAEGGHNLTAAEARRLACTASIIPVVLGSDSEILDQGRARRLFTPAQRRAMRLRDKTCRAEGCDHPATWSEAHHWDAWATGGQTNLDDAITLCPYHHHRIHDPTYRAELLPNGDVRFHRRT